MSEQKSAVERLADERNEMPDYTPTVYDRGRVHQRHDMTMQLLEAIEADRARAGVVAEESEWEYGWEADEEVRTTTRPRGPRILFDGVPYPPETISAFARGRRIRRRKAGPWVPVKQEGAEA